MEEKEGMIYRSMGVSPIINAAGPISKYGGGRYRPQVVEAMTEAFRVPVQIDELNIHLSFRTGNIQADFTILAGNDTAKVPTATSRLNVSGPIVPNLFRIVS